MVENLLWPKKLTTPPQLLIDPEVIFNGEKTPNSIQYNESLVSIKGAASVRYIESVPSSFTIGLVADIAYSDSTLRTDLKLPFQDISAEILQYKMHLWDMNGAYLLSTPYKTESRTSLNVSASIQTRRTDKNSLLKKPLFKMVGESLEDGGSKPQFSSNMGYSVLTYTVPRGFKENLELEFPDMFNDDEYRPYEPTLMTLAIETVVKVNVISATGPDGFKIGVVSS